MPAAKTTIVAAVRTSDGRDAPVLDHQRRASAIPLVAFDGTAEGDLRDGTHARARRRSVRASSQTRFAVLSTSTPAAAEDRDASRPLGLRRALARRPHALRDPVPRAPRRTRATTSAAVSLVTGKPVGGAIVDRREPDEEMNGVALVARTRSCGRRLGVHALREAERHRVRPRARHCQAARVLRRSAVALERAALVSAVRLSLADGGRSLELAKPRREPARGRRHHAPSR